MNRIIVLLPFLLYSLSSVLHERIFFYILLLRSTFRTKKGTLSDRNDTSPFWRDRGGIGVTISDRILSWWWFRDRKSMILRQGFIRYARIRESNFRWTTSVFTKNPFHSFPKQCNQKKGTKTSNCYRNIIKQEQGHIIIKILLCNTMELEKETWVILKKEVFGILFCCFAQFSNSNGHKTISWVMVNFHCVTFSKPFHSMNNFPIKKNKKFVSRNPFKMWFSLRLT